MRDLDALAKLLRAKGRQDLVDLLLVDWGGMCETMVWALPMDVQEEVAGEVR
jgi:hypothetical protein